MSSGRLTRITLAQAAVVSALALGSSPLEAAPNADGQPTRQSQMEQQGQQGQQGQGITTSAPSRETAHASQGPLTHPEDAAVRIPVEAYLRGHETGDAESFRRAFAKDARLWWVRDGQVATRTADEYITAVSGRRATDHRHRRRLVKLEISGETAVATIEMDYPGVRLTDQLTLQKQGDEWKITVKSFSSEPRPAVS